MYSPAQRGMKSPYAVGDIIRWSDDYESRFHERIHGPGPFIVTEVVHNPRNTKWELIRISRLCGTEVGTSTEGFYPLFFEIDLFLNEVAKEK